MTEAKIFRLIFLSCAAAIGAAGFVGHSTLTKRSAQYKEEALQEIKNTSTYKMLYERDMKNNEEGKKQAQDLLNDAMNSYTDGKISFSELELIRMDYNVLMEKYNQMEQYYNSEEYLVDIMENYSSSVEAIAEKYNQSIKDKASSKVVIPVTLASAGFVAAMSYMAFDDKY